MTTAEAIDICNIIQDKFGSPNVITSEWLKLLNMGQLEVLNRMFPDTVGGVANFETDENTSMNVRQLVFTVLTTTATMPITFSSLTILLQAASGDATCSIFRISSVGMLFEGNIFPVKFVKRNNNNVYENNVFKKSSDTNPYYTIHSNNGSLPGIFLRNVSPANQLSITCIKTPKILDIANSPDWDDYMMNQVILQAVKLAGIGTRDEELIMDIRNSGVQSGQ